MKLLISAVDAFFYTTLSRTDRLRQAGLTKFPDAALLPHFPDLDEAFQSRMGELTTWEHELGYWMDWCQALALRMGEPFQPEKVEPFVRLHGLALYDEVHPALERLIRNRAKLAFLIEGFPSMRQALVETGLVGLGRCFTSADEARLALGEDVQPIADREQWLRLIQA